MGATDAAGCTLCPVPGQRRGLGPAGESGTTHTVTHSKKHQDGKPRALRKPSRGMGWCPGARRRNRSRETGRRARQDPCGHTCREGQGRRLARTGRAGWCSEAVARGTQRDAPVEASPGMATVRLRAKGTYASGLGIAGGWWAAGEEPEMASPQATQSLSTLNVRGQPGETGSGTRIYTGVMCCG